MTITPAITRQRRSKRARTASAALLAWSFMLVAVAASPAGAQEGCGEISFSFDGTRLLNDGISDSAGPFPADIPAGVYTVTLVAYDDHGTQVGIASQAGEQYRVVLDSGYVSPLSTDIPDEVNSTTTVFNDQQIGESTSISVEHGLAPGINSVDVVCVGFTPVTPPEPIEEPANDPTSDPTEDIVDTETTPDDESAEPENADEVDEPAEPVEEEVVEEVDEPAEPVEPEEPIQDIGDPVELVRDPQPEEPDDTEVSDETQETVVLDESVSREPTEEPGVEQVASATPEEEVEVEVLGETEEAVVPLLAITGPGNHAFALVSLGLLMIVGGAFLVSRERRIGTTR